MAQNTPKIERFTLTESLEYAMVNLNEFSAFSGSDEKRVNEKAAALFLVKHVCGEEAEILYEKSGRPFLKNGPHISITHSHDHLAVIFCKTGRVGIDIEKVRDKIINIRRKFMSAEELTHVSDSLEAHTVYWCAKEALYKAADIEGLIFADQLFIEPFHYSDNGGEIKAVLRHNNSEKKFNLQYRVLNGHILVYTL